LVAAGIGILAIFLFIFILYGWKKAVITLSVLVSFMVVLGLFMKLVDYALSLS
jgi:preprotein translocase subunit SecD